VILRIGISILIESKISDILALVLVFFVYCLSLSNAKYCTVMNPGKKMLLHFF